LSLAILADYLENDEEALRLYQPFKFAVIAALPQESNWVLTEADLDAELAGCAVRPWLLRRTDGRKDAGFKGKEE
jgi:hypothetical protein